jgi:hypothetical protein
MEKRRPILPRASFQRGSKREEPSIKEEGKLHVFSKSELAADFRKLPELSEFISQVSIQDVLDIMQRPQW